MLATYVGTLQQPAQPSLSSEEPVADSKFVRGSFQEKKGDILAKQQQPPLMLQSCESYVQRLDAHRACEDLGLGPTETRAIAVATHADPRGGDWAGGAHGGPVPLAPKDFKTESALTWSYHPDTQEIKTYASALEGMFSALASHRSVVMCGRAGAGKTKLCQAVAQRWTQMESRSHWIQVGNMESLKKAQDKLVDAGCLIFDEFAGRPPEQGLHQGHA